MSLSAPAKKSRSCPEVCRLGTLSDAARLGCGGTRFDGRVTAVYSVPVPVPAGLGLGSGSEGRGSDDALLGSVLSWIDVVVMMWWSRSVPLRDLLAMDS